MLDHTLGLMEWKTSLQMKWLESRFTRLQIFVPRHVCYSHKHLFILGKRRRGSQVACRTVPPLFNFCHPSNRKLMHVTNIDLDIRATEYLSTFVWD